MSKPIRNITFGGGHDNTTTWLYGRVVWVEDPYDSGRIKVRIANIDNTYRNDEEIIDDNTNWVTPLLPLHLNIIPQVGETVRVLIQDHKNPFINRVYMGPVISQKENYKNDPHYFTSRAGTNQSLSKLSKSWLQYPETRNIEKDWDIFPNKKDISLHSRGNADIILKKRDDTEEIILRVSKWDFNNNKKLNKKNPTYITINHTKPIKGVVNKEERDQLNSLNLEKDRTHINVVSDNVNLISHKGSSVKGEAPRIIGNDILEQIDIEHNKLHPLVYGDAFWEFVRLVRNYVVGHTHPYDGLPPDPSLSTLELDQWVQRNIGNKTKDENGNTIYNSNFLSKGVKTN